MINLYSSLLNQFVNYAEIVLNTIAIIIVVRAVIIGLRNQIRCKSSAKHSICKGISDALNFNLATESMKIIIGRSANDLILIGGILILKALITALFILEIKQDEMRMKNEIIDNKRIKSKK